MRRKDQLKKLNQLKIKSMSDKQLSFIFLLNLINYKKFKSLKKRFLMMNYSFYKSFLFLLKHQHYFNFSRLHFIQNFNKNKYSFITVNFFLKKMFGRNISLLNYLDSSDNVYIWNNGVFSKKLHNDQFFFKTMDLSQFSGNNIMLHKEPIDFGTDILLFKRNLGLECDIYNNNFICFNVFLLNTVELYKILTYCFINKIN